MSLSWILNLLIQILMNANLFSLSLSVSLSCRIYPIIKHRDLKEIISSLVLSLLLHTCIYMYVR